MAQAGLGLLRLAWRRLWTGWMTARAGSTEEDGVGFGRAERGICVEPRPQTGTPASPHATGDNRRLRPRSPLDTTKPHVRGLTRPLRRLAGLIGAMARHRDKAGALKGAVDHLLKVTRSSWPGLLPCYRVPDLPRTNNDLEHLFGSQRHHERRATGRKGASPSLVLRGSVRLVAATVTRLRPVEPCDLAPRDRQSWCRLRGSLASRRYSRTLRTRFRRDPEAYLRDLEHQLGQLTLPS